jgi:putative phosphoribosyl transferase
MDQVAVDEGGRRAFGIAKDPAIAGELRLPKDPRGLVVLADLPASGGRQGLLADALYDSRIATISLRPDADESESARPIRSRVMSMADRMVAAADWVATQPELAGLSLGLFGAEAAGGAALAAAARRPGTFRAVVSRGGRPDLVAGLSDLHTATLFIVAGHDDPSITINQEAMTRVRGIAELELLPGTAATLAEPGAMRHVAHLARRWFARFLA